MISNNRRLILFRSKKKSCMDQLLKTACILIPMLLLSDFRCRLTKYAEAWSLNGSTILTPWALLLIALFVLFISNCFVKLESIL